jgi:hypothetical protein
VKRLLREEGDPIKKEFALCGSLGKENGVNGKGLTGGAQPASTVHTGANKQYNL